MKFNVLKEHDAIKNYLVKLRRQVDVEFNCERCDKKKDRISVGRLCGNLKYFCHDDFGFVSRNSSPTSSRDFSLALERISTFALIGKGGHIAGTIHVDDGRDNGLSALATFLGH